MNRVEAKICPVCGTGFDASDNFCSMCGTKLQPGEASESPALEDSTFEEPEAQDLFLGPILVEEHEAVSLVLDAPYRERHNWARTIRIVFLVLAFLGIAIPAFLYLGKGRIEFEVLPVAGTVSLIRQSNFGIPSDDQSIEFRRTTPDNQREIFSTGLLRSGHYLLRSEAPGFEPLHKKIWIGFGRRNEKTVFKMSPAKGQEYATGMGANMWGEGLTIFNYVGRNYIMQSPDAETEASMARLPRQISGDFTLTFDIVESGSTPDFCVAFLGTDGKLFKVTFREHNFMWHGSLPPLQFGTVPFIDDHTPNTLRISRTGTRWEVSARDRPLVSTDTAIADPFSEILFDIPKPRRIFMLGNVNVQSAGE